MSVFIAPAAAQAPHVVLTITNSSAPRQPGADHHQPQPRAEQQHQARPQRQRGADHHQQPTAAGADRGAGGAPARYWSSPAAAAAAPGPRAGRRAGLIAGGAGIDRGAGGAPCSAASADSDARSPYSTRRSGRQEGLLWASASRSLRPFGALAVRQRGAGHHQQQLLRQVLALG